MNYDFSKDHLEIGPYIRRTRLFDDFYGLYKEKGVKVVVRIFPYSYNLSGVAIKRIKDIHKELNNCIYAQKYINSIKDSDTGMESLIFMYYPKTSFFLFREASDYYYKKLIPSFMYRGILCLQEIKTKSICHHDICLENIYFGKPISKYNEKNDDTNNINNDKNKNINQDPLEFDFKLLNWTFATHNKHAISIIPRYQYDSKFYESDPYKQDLYDFALTVLSLFNEEGIPELIVQMNQINQINHNTKIQWIPFLKNYHQYPEHCKKVKEFFETIFTNSSEKSDIILAKLIFSGIFTSVFFG